MNSAAPNSAALNAAVAKPGPLHFSITGGGGTVDRRVELAQMLGFDGIWMGNGGGGADTFMLLTRVATQSDTLRLGTSVFLLPLRHPTVVAQQVATLDMISKGRFLFGVGVGGDRPRDFRIYGLDPKERGARMEESLRLMKQLWSGDEVNHHGRFYSVEGKLGVKSYTEPTPPVLIGQRGGPTPLQQRAYDRVVNVAQGWLPYTTAPELFARGLEAIVERGGKNLILGVVEWTHIGTGDGQAAIEYSVQRKAADYGRAGAAPGAAVERMRRLVNAGNAEAVANRLKQYVDMGVTEFVFNWAGEPGTEEDQMRRAAADVIPAVREYAAARLARA